MRRLLGTIVGSALLFSLSVGSAAGDAGVTSITDIAGDANLLNGQGVVAAGEQSTAPASYGPADIRAVAFETTFVAVPVGDDGIDYQATGLNIHYRTEATPMSDGPTFIYRLNANVDGCNSFLQAFLRGASSTPNDPADKSIQWRQLDAGCPDGVLTVTNTGWTVTIDSTAKELVMSFPYSKLSANRLAFMDEGSILSGLVANTRTNFGTPGGSVTAPQFDESPTGQDFEVGSDMPEDVPCTLNCPGSAQQA
jgi:hypothetical protein